MTAGIFCEWVKKMDRRMTGRKVALLLDNCPAHPKVITGLKNITIFYLPPNTTSILSPMDQGIIRNFKYYKKSSLNNRHVRCLDSGSEFTVSVLDALTEAQRAWTQVKKHFKTVGPTWLSGNMRQTFQMMFVLKGSQDLNSRVLMTRLLQQRSKKKVPKKTALPTKKPTPRNPQSQPL
jgi:transposase